MTKPIATLDIVSAIYGAIKTGAVILAMIILEYSKMEKAKAKLSEAIAKNDLEIEKAKNEKIDKPNSVIIDDYLERKMLQRDGNINHSDNDKRS